MDEKELFWEQLTLFLKNVMQEGSYITWVKPSYPLRLERQTISIVVPNSLSKNFWEKNLAKYILQHSLEHYGVEYRPIFVVGHKKELTPTTPSQILVQDTISNEYASETAISNELDDVTGYPLNKAYTFDTFVIGQGNEMAHVASLAVCDRPGSTYNPLLIYGGSGLGKTHLMQAIGNEIKRRNPNKKVKYATSESFTNDFISSIRNGVQKDFREMYRSIDVLLIDDIQFLSNKDSTQEEFFHTFNALHANGKQIVLTCDRSPKDINNLEHRLITRFNWGLSTDITPPDLETRIAILRKKAMNKQIDISPDILTYIANHVDTNVRELEGALLRVQAYAAVNGQDITIQLASEALHISQHQENMKSLTIEEIIKEVSHFYKIPVGEIKGTKRNKEILYARQIAMYLSRQLLEVSYPKIGEQFGNKNHTTVMHAYEKITDAITNNSKIRQDVERIQKKLKS